jgi:hypothetical protein
MKTEEMRQFWAAILDEAAAIQKISADIIRLIDQREIPEGKILNETPTDQPT